jgi:riboflavin kinase/FMN adenylyltransferase
MGQPSHINPATLHSRGCAGARLVRGVGNARAEEGCALTIGNFDGVHRGHQALIRRLAAAALDRGLAPALLTFEPHPVEVLAPRRAPARLTSFRQKSRLLLREPLQRVVCARFDRALAAMSPLAFIDEVLCRRLRVRHLLVGDDFRFGHGGTGDFSTLADAADEGRFTLARLETVTNEGERISSTRIREHLAKGELDAAAALLGRRFSLCGRVARGQRLGRTLGFPTANFPLRRAPAPVSGVFAVHLRDGAGTAFEGVANVGRRPTVDGVEEVGRRPTVDGVEERLEVHVLDFTGDLYGREFEVVFLERLRGEQRFSGLDALKAQIGRDVEAARSALASHRQRENGDPEAP